MKFSDNTHATDSDTAIRKQGRARRRIQYRVRRQRLSLVEARGRGSYRLPCDVTLRALLGAQYPRLEAVRVEDATALAKRQAAAGRPVLPLAILRVGAVWTALDVRISAYWAVARGGSGRAERNRAQAKGDGPFGGRCCCACCWRCRELLVCGRRFFERAVALADGGGGEFTADIVHAGIKY